MICSSTKVAASRGYCWRTLSACVVMLTTAFGASARAEELGGLVMIERSDVAVVGENGQRGIVLFSYRQPADLVVVEIRLPTANPLLALVDNESKRVEAQLVSLAAGEPVRIEMDDQRLLAELEFVLVQDAPRPQAPPERGPVAQDRLLIDRRFEGAYVGIRVGSSRLQVFQLEGSLVTAWSESLMDSSESEAILARFERARLAKFYPPPPTEEGMIYEQDELDLRFWRGGGYLETRCPHRPSCPAQLLALVENLEEMASKGERGAESGDVAFLADDLDVPNYPAKVTIAEALENSGFAFRPLNELGGFLSATALRARKSLGFLVSGQPEEAEGTRDWPVYFEHQERRYRLRRFVVRFPGAPS